MHTTMRLGLGSYTFPWAIGIGEQQPRAPLTVFDLLGTAADLGVGVVQICDNLPLHRLDSEQVAALRHRAAELALGVEVGTRGIGAEHLRTYLDLARRLGSALLRVVIDSAEHQPEPDEVTGILTPLVPEFEAARVVLALENHDRFSAATFARIVQQIGSPHVGICLDTANSFGALEGPDAVIAALAPYVANVHVKDFVVRRMPHNLGFVIEGRPVGQGQLDIPRLLRQLAAAGRDPNVVVELWTPPEADLSATIAKERRWAEESVEYLRTLIPD